MKFLATEKADNVSIVDLIHKALDIVEPARPVQHLHASALTGEREFCPREVALVRKLGRIPYPQKRETSMTVTFHEGRDKQRRLNEDWLRHLMVGDWQCDACGRYWKFCKSPTKCDQCGGGARQHIRYREVVYYHPSGAQGSLDATLDVGKPRLRLVEFKILAEKEWLDIKGPLAEHRIRSQLYLEIIKASDHPHKATIDTDRIHVLYCLRGFGKLDKEKARFSPFKEFIVHPDPVEVQLYFRKAWAVKKAQQSEWELIPEGVCGTMFDKRCNTCCVVKECFSGKFPATVPWKAAGGPGGLQMVSGV